MPTLKDLQLPEIGVPGNSSVSASDGKLKIRVDELEKELEEAWGHQMLVNELLIEQIAELRLQKVKIDLDPLTTRVAELEKRPVLPGDLLNRILAVEGSYIESDKDPNFDDASWRVWIKSTKDITTWQQTSTAIARIPGVNDGMELGSVTFAMPDAVPGDALKLADNTYQINIRGGLNLTYSNRAKVQSYSQAAFNPGTYSNIAFKLYDAAGNEVVGSEGSLPVEAGDNEMAFGTKLQNFPAAVKIIWTFTFTDTTKAPAVYEYSLT